MNRKAFTELTEGKPVILDGATGSNLAKQGMPRDACPEAWILEHPELLCELQRQYADAGSQIIYAPTFGANRISLAKHGLERDVERLNAGLAELTRKAVGDRVLVAGDFTTTGELLEPLGELEEEELYDAYCEQLRVLVSAGVDLLVAETMLSVQETQVALRAALDVCELPVLCTLTVSEDGRALFGGTAAEAVETLQKQGASAVGVNCSVGPDQLTPVVAAMKEAAKVPVIVKPNAGLPEISASGEAVYRMTPETFVTHMERLVEAGAGMIGGCCGTTPEFIRQLTKRFG